MMVPPKTDPRWRAVLVGSEPKFQSLATKLVVTRLRDTVSNDSGRLQAAVEELHRFFVANTFAARDLSAL